MRRPVVGLEAVTPAPNSITWLFLDADEPSVQLPGLGANASLAGLVPVPIQETLLSTQKFS